MRDDGAQNHADAKHDQDRAVSLRLVVAGRRGAEFVVCGKHLDEDAAQLAAGGGDAVAGGAVAGGEELGGDDVGGRVGAEVEGDLGDDVEAD